VSVGVTVGWATEFTQQVRNREENPAMPERASTVRTRVRRPRSNGAYSPASRAPMRVAARSKSVGIKLPEKTSRRSRLRDFGSRRRGRADRGLEELKRCRLTSRVSTEAGRRTGVAAAKELGRRTDGDIRPTAGSGERSLTSTRHSRARRGSRRTRLQTPAIVGPRPTGHSCRQPAR